MISCLLWDLIVIHFVRHSFRFVVAVVVVVVVALFAFVCRCRCFCCFSFILALAKPWTAPHSVYWPRFYNEYRCELSVWLDCFALWWLCDDDHHHYHHVDYYLWVVLHTHAQLRRWQAKDTDTNVSTDRFSYIFGRHVSFSLSLFCSLISLVSKLSTWPQLNLFCCCI